MDNLSNLVTIPNNLLQGDFNLAGINTGRFLINSTVGVLGLVDVAQHLGMTDYNKEDYGQSLAKAGVGPGCYIVLPILGSRSLRHFSGNIVDQSVSNCIQITSHCVSTLSKCWHDRVKTVCPFYSNHV